MATRYWVGGAPSRAHKVRFTPTVSGLNNFTLTAGDYSTTITSSAGTVADVCSLMLAALQDSTITAGPMLHGIEVDWTNSGTYLEAEAKTAGEWFKFTGSATGGDSWTIATQTEARGPKILTCPQNWDGGTIPANGDTLVFQLKQDTIKHDLDAWSANTYPAVYIEAFPGSIGLPYENAGSYKYKEYRPRYFKAGMTVAQVGIVNGLGINSPLVRLDTSSIQTALRVSGSGSGQSTPTENGAAAVVWQGTHASNVVRCNRGSLGVASERGSVATVANLYCDFIDIPTSDSIVNVGPGVTLTNIYANGGLLGLGSTWSGTLYRRGGRVYIMPGVTIGTIDTTERPLVLGG